MLSNILAQQRGTISGTVKDKVSGEAIIGANVLVFQDSLKSKEPLKGTATNRYGFFSLPDIPFGQVYLSVSYIGYESLLLQIKVSKESSEKKIEIVLTSKAVTIGDVVVQDSKYTDFTYTASTIDIEPAMVQMLPSIGGETDLFRALQMLPGVTVATEISTGIYVRGGSPDQNLTLVDGVVVYNPAHLGGFATTFNADALQDIKLIKGAFPAEYGGRLSSVLDVTMREGTKERVKGSFDVSLIGSRLTLEGPFDTNATFIFSGRSMYLGKVIPAFEKLSVIPRYTFFDFNGKVNYILSEKDRIFFSGFFSSDKLLEPASNKDVEFNIKWQNSTVNTSWVRISNPQLFIYTSLLYTNYNFQTIIADKDHSTSQLDFFTSSQINDFYLRREMEYFGISDNIVKGGVEVTYHNFSTTTSDYLTKELQYKNIYGTDINALEASVYLQDDFKINNDLKGNTGLRLYYFQASKMLKIEPRISLSYYFLERFIIRSSFAIAHQGLHLLNRQDIFLPTDVWYPSAGSVLPSRSIQGSFGFEALSFDKSFLFSVEAYYKKLDNIYEYREDANFNIDTPFDEKITKGKGEAFGVEFFFNKRIGILSGWIGYTTAWTKRYFDELNNGHPFYPRYDRRHDISLVLSLQPSEQITCGLTWTYGTGQAYSLPIGQYMFTGLDHPNSNTTDNYYNYSRRDEFRLPPFHKLDLSFNYLINISEKNNLEISLNIYNAYNRNNPFSKYIGYKIDEVSGKRIPVLKEFTLFPFLPTIGIKYKF